MQADTQCMTRRSVRCGGCMHIYIGYIHMYYVVRMVCACINISVLLSLHLLVCPSQGPRFELCKFQLRFVFSLTLFSLSHSLIFSLILCCFFFRFFVRLFCIFFSHLFVQNFVLKENCFVFFCWGFLVFVCKINLVAVAAAASANEIELTHRLEWQSDRPGRKRQR